MNMTINDQIMSRNGRQCAKNRIDHCKWTKINRPKMAVNITTEPKIAINDHKMNHTCT